MSAELSLSRTAPSAPNFAQIPRARIVSALLSETRIPHQLICAPPGFGKTCILREAHGRCLSDVGSAHWLEPETLSAWRGEGHATIFLDRADEADGAALARLTAPHANLRVIMAARRRPALQTADMELQERLRVWTHTTLRCDADDIGALLNTLGAPETPRTIARDIARRAEGWIAGAKFLALHWLSKDGLDGRVQGTISPSLTAYFDETILAVLTPAQRERLVLVSICDDLCPALYERITGETDLATIVEAGALLFPTNKPAWFRFHRLFRQHLANRADTLRRRDRSGAHRTAAEWHLGAGAPTEAAAHALECGDQSFAADIIDRAARGFIANGQISEALAWLDQVPLIEHHGRPRIRLFHVTALAVAGRLDEAERMNGDVDALLSSLSVTPDWAAEVAAHVRYHRELIDFYRNPAGQDFRRLDRLLQDTASAHPVVHGETMLIKGGALYRQGDFTAARGVIAESLPHLESSASWYAFTIGHVMLAQIDHAAGAAHQAMERCAALIDDLAQRANMRIPAMAPAATMLALLAFERNDLATAAHWLAEAEDLLPALRSLEWDFEHRLLEARLDAAHGRWEDAARRAEAAQALAQRLGLPASTARAAATMAFIHAALGDLTHAQPPAPRLGAPNAHSKPDQHNLARLTYQLAALRSRHADGHGGRAIQDAIALARQLDHTPSVLEALLCQAAALFEQDDVARAYRVLREALKLGEPTGNARAFLDFSDPSFQNLLAAYRRSREAVDDSSLQWLTHAERGIGAAPRMSASTRTCDVSSARLTPKEAEVLHLVAEGRSNQEIAADLMISLATVKWHMRNILSKLDAPSRSAAIARARQLRLIA